MYRKILIPTDGSTLSEVVAAAAIDFARDAGAAVVGLATAPVFRRPLTASAIDDQSQTESDHLVKTNRTLDKHLAAIEHCARVANVPFEGRKTMSDDPARDIVDAATEARCDLIFMGSHHRRGLARLLHASVTAKVLELSALPVTIHRVTQEALVRHANQLDRYDPATAFDSSFRSH